MLPPVIAELNVTKLEQGQESKHAFRRHGTTADPCRRTKGNQQGRRAPCGVVHKLEANELEGEVRGAVRRVEDRDLLIDLVQGPDAAAVVCKKAAPGAMSKTPVSFQRVI